NAARTAASASPSSASSGSAPPPTAICAARSASASRHGSACTRCAPAAVPDQHDRAPHSRALDDRQPPTTVLFRKEQSARSRPSVGQGYTPGGASLTTERWTSSKTESTGIHAVEADGILALEMGAQHLIRQGLSHPVIGTGALPLPAVRIVALDKE